MEIQVRKTETISGTVTSPSSKSHTVRALLLATMASGTSALLNALASDDTDQAVGVCRDLGATVKVYAQSNHRIDIEVESNGLPLRPASKTVFTGDSGITTRFVLPMLGLRTGLDPIQFDCGPQMRQRPITPLVDALGTLGMRVTAAPDHHGWPFFCEGPLKGGSARVDGITSQFCSALLLSLPCAPEDSVITVENLHERPYVAMTTRWLDEQAIRYQWQSQGGRDVFHISGGQRYRSFEKSIPGDFSSASYLIAAGVLRGGEVVLNGLDMNDAQGDKRFISILQEMGADISVNQEGIIVRGGRSLNSMTIDCNDIPDLVPTLAVIATQAEDTTHLVNVAQARLKETDRLRSMRTELAKMGADITEEPDSLTIRQSSLSGAQLHGYHDHRTIMALSIAGLCAQGGTIITTAEGINKTFPNFVSMMQSLGARINLV
ncbi:3-phosphoshikimate 1-carboxyvinyltransferase [Candidatus Uhrbacteria bacterium]|nr:3-phosphoshikimate 1-carboxyvinyltransferase [Candidatus Uhrbacteria bacterium]